RLERHVDDVPFGVIGPAVIAAPQTVGLRNSVGEGDRAVGALVADEAVAAALVLEQRQVLAQQADRLNRFALELGHGADGPRAARRFPTPCTAARSSSWRTGVRTGRPPWPGKASRSRPNRSR